MRWFLRLVGASDITPALRGIEAARASQRGKEARVRMLCPGVGDLRSFVPALLGKAGREDPEPVPPDMTALLARLENTP